MAVSSVPVASLPWRLFFACLFTVLGAVLVFNPKGISTELDQQNLSFTPWGRRRGDWKGPSPARVVGAFFLLGGIVAAISIALRP